MLFNILIYISQRIPTNCTLHNIVSTAEITHNIKIRHNYRVIHLSNNIHCLKIYLSFLNYFFYLNSSQEKKKKKKKKHFNL